MARRGYWIVRETQKPELYMSSTHGDVSRFNYDGSEAFVPAIYGQEAARKPGIYTASGDVSGRGRLYATIGKKIDPASEARRLDRLLSRRSERAHTFSPGIKGFQQRADAASSAQDYRRQETRKLRDIVSKLASESELALRTTASVTSRIPRGSRHQHDLNCLEEIAGQLVCKTKLPGRNP